MAGTPPDPGSPPEPPAPALPGGLVADVPFDLDDGSGPAARPAPAVEHAVLGDPVLDHQPATARDGRAAAGAVPRRVQQVTLGVGGEPAGRSGLLLRHRRAPRG